MMEVKQSTPTDLNALTAGTSNGKPNDDMDVISELEASKLKSDILSVNELPQNGLLSDASNGFTDAGDGLDLDELIDLNDTVNPELEDALLGEDDDDVVDKLLAEVVPKAAAVIEGKSDDGPTAASLHNPGDDLDKLISKINDLEDCIETSADKDEVVSSNAVNADNTKEAEEDICEEDNEVADEEEDKVADEEEDKVADEEED
ncbi:nucleolin-like, partial [Rhagoletis pomonella]|uniref:nucleolin-like n=1 Tax=Rhagoletis pomonella TaxID=28610 RepID=UPI0017802639